MTKKELFKAVHKTERLFKSKLEGDFGLIEIKGPLFLDPKTGLNDDLSGTEKPLSFRYKDRQFEIVQSLAKWKRNALQEYDFKHLEGLFVEMHAIRPDESSLSKYHDLHVDQYDWEKIIKKEDRTIEFLRQEVTLIYRALYETKELLRKEFKHLKYSLPKEMTFISSEELLKLYPLLNSDDREKEFAKKHKAIFISEIGHKLSNGEEHDLRAPDYDDWSLNGDLIVWDEVNKDALEISSMGIRVDSESIISQHKLLRITDKLKLPFHKKVVGNKLPLSIGGGIGRSRVNMFLLEQDHIMNVK